MNCEKVIAVFVPLRRDVLYRMSKHKPGRGYSLEDVVQEAYMRLIRLGSDDEVIDNPLGYLLRIAFNVMYEWNSRKGGIHVNFQDAAEELCDTDARQPENIRENEELVTSVRSLIRGLPRRQQQALTLRLDDELTYEQIADTLGITYRMVLRDLTNAYRTLRARVRSRHQLEQLQIPAATIRGAQERGTSARELVDKPRYPKRLIPERWAEIDSVGELLTADQTDVSCAGSAETVQQSTTGTTRRGTRLCAIRAKGAAWLGPQAQSGPPEIHPY